jgi:hypothetical protein
MKKEIIEIYLNKHTFKDLEHAEKIAKKWGFNTSFRKKKGLITETEYIFKQKDKSRYCEKNKVVINDNLSYLIGIKFKK